LVLSMIPMSESNLDADPGGYHIAAFISATIASSP